MFALWGLFSFCILWYCFSTERLSCTCCHENPARVNNRTCCTMGECNCACMPVQNPFGRVGLFISAFPVFCSIVFLLFLWFLNKCFPWYNPFWLSFISFIFCVVIMVLCLCVFLLFQLCSWTYFSFKTVCLLWFIWLWDLCYFFKMMLLCFLSLGVQMQMPNEIISVYTASVSVILFIATHYWKN